MAQIQNPGFSLLAVLMVLMLVLAGFIPAFYASNSGQNTKVLHVNQEDRERIIVSSLYAEAGNLTAPSGASLRIIDHESDIVKSTTILSVGETNTVQINGYDITVTYKAETNTENIFAVQYPVQYQWTDIQIAFINAIGVLTLLILLILILMLIEGGKT